MNLARLQPWSMILTLTMAVMWAGPHVVGAQSQAPSPSEQQESASEQPAVGPGTKNRSDSWYDKGILLTVYGNDKAAVAHFQKAIELDPQHHDAYFQLGVSYGELGQYDMALRQIDKAIELNPEKAVYYYGRARVHLLSGDKQKANSDFEKAAEMGSRDAAQYLKRAPEQ